MTPNNRLRLWLIGAVFTAAGLLAGREAQDLGVGGFFETSMVGFEWPTDRTVNRPGLVYNVVAGFSLTFGPAGRH